MGQRWRSGEEELSDRKAAFAKVAISTVLVHSVAISLRKREGKKGPGRGGPLALENRFLCCAKAFRIRDVSLPLNRLGRSLMGNASLCGGEERTEPWKIDRRAFISLSQREKAKM